MDTEHTLTFPGRFDRLGEISEFVLGAAKRAGLDASAIYAVQLAVDEACTNIIQHAYGGEGRGDVECTCRLDQDGLTVILRDHGCPFDPSRVPQPDLDGNLEDRSGTGLGVYLMRRLMDEVRFECGPDSSNVLTMVKRKGTAF